jgi:transcriptional regulator with GAF, ATPase, and Fis domain
LPVLKRPRGWNDLKDVALARIVRQTLRAHGTIAGAARELSIDRTQMKRLMKRFAIDRP